MIYNSFENIGFLDTIKKYKLSPEALDKLFPDGIGEIISLHYEFIGDQKCSIMEDLIYAFFRINYLSNYKVSYGDSEYVFLFSTDFHTGALMMEIRDKNYGDEIGIYATPFYEGYCQLPIDISYYDDTQGITHEPNDVLQEYVDINEDNFKSFKDITEWFNNEYPKLILSNILPYWNQFRQEYN